MSTKDRTPEVDSALHIIKGAIVKVLHTPLTVTTASKKNEGRLTVEYHEASEPTKEVVKQIEDLANKKIKENVPIVVTKMSRAEAERIYEGRVNETFIYDKIAVPAQITEVNVLLIENWNVNCCGGTHTKTTGEVGSIKILRLNFRANKKELEFVFEVSPASSSTNNNTPSVAAPKVELSAKKEPRYDDVNSVTDKVIAQVLEELKAQKIDLAGKEEAIVAAVTPRVAQHINTLKNHAYASAFNCHKTDRTKMMG